MAVMSEEDEGTDTNIVILMQSLRLMSVIVAVPFLVMHFLGARMVGTAASLAVHDGLSYWYVLPFAIIAGILADRIGISTPYLMAPIIVAMAASLQIGTLNTIDPFLMAAAQIGIPVQWKPKGNNTLYPLSLLYQALKSHLVMENACPKWSRPFIYAYGKVWKNLGF